MTTPRSHRSLPETEHIKNQLLEKFPWYAVDWDGRQTLFHDEPGLIECLHVDGAGWWESHGLKVVLDEHLDMKGKNWRETKRRLAA